MAVPTVASSGDENKKDVTVTVDGRRYVVDRQHLRTPDNLTNKEKVQAAADTVKDWGLNGHATVPNQFVQLWLSQVARSADSRCCNLLHAPCAEHSAAVGIAEYILAKTCPVATYPVVTYHPYSTGIGRTTTWTST